MKIKELANVLLAIPVKALRVANYEREGYHLEAFLESSQLLDVAAFLKKKGFFLEDITAVDLKRQIQVIYHLSTLNPVLRVTLRVSTDKENPFVPSIACIFPGANWHERETYEFFGINFENHPCLAPLLLPPDFKSHPLLKEAGELKSEAEIWPLRIDYGTSDI